LVAELIPQKRKSHTVGENLIKPACKIIVGKMLGQYAVQEIGNFPLSNSMITFILMTCHMMLKRFCMINLFSLQVDESTDFTNKSYVVAFVRFINDGEIHENFLRCKELPETSKG
jgi:hypothetical protein